MKVGDLVRVKNMPWKDYGIVLEINATDFGGESLHWELRLHNEKLPFVRGISRDIALKNGYFNIEELKDVAKDMVAKLASLY